MLPAVLALYASSLGPAPVPVVQCTAQTVPVVELEDAADDPAIWVHPDRPDQSLVIGTNKKSGLRVYDLSGALVQSLDDGRVNNVDVLVGARLDDSSDRTDLVAASNRSDNSIALYRIDRERGRLERLGSVPTALNEVYGLCGYVDTRDHDAARVVVSCKSGVIKVFGITRAGDRLVAAPMGERAVGGQVEGLAADVEQGVLYVGEEAVGVWKYPLNLGSDTPRSLLDVVRSPIGGHLAPDVEGITLYEAGPGRGWVIVSCQGEDRFAVYERVGGRYVGSFRLEFRDGAGTDPVTHTDGIAVLSTPIGTHYPAGLMVVQDDNAGARQNFKLACWQTIETRLKQHAEPPSAPSRPE